MNLERYSIHAFLDKFQIKNEMGEVLDFRNHSFLWDIYKDFSPKLCVMKAAQVGMTTCEIIKLLWGVKNKELDSIYILPTDSDVGTMVGSKVNRFIAQNPILQEWVKDKDTIEQKQVGERYIHFRGSWTQKQAIMVTSDWNCYKKGTEVLTKEGWKTIENISLKDELATYNELNGIEWQNPVFLLKKKNQPLLEFKNSNFSLSVTPEHRMFIEKNGWKVKKASSLQNISKFSLGIANTKLIGKKSKFIKIEEKIWKRPVGSCKLPIKCFSYKKYYPAKWFYRFLGWYLSEGNVSRIKGRLTGRINITQIKNAVYKSDIENTLTSLGVKWSHSFGIYSFSDWALAIYLDRLGNSKNKYIPKTILNEPFYLSELLESIYKGDAFRNKHTEYLNTASKRLADDIQTAWLYLGKMSSITSIQDRTCRMYRIGVRRHQKIQFNLYKKIRKSGYIIQNNELEEEVYCLSVPNTLIYVRNGKVMTPIICGQCYDEVDSCKQDVVEQYSTRLQHSKYKYEHFFSHPSASGFGVHRYWQKSDQKHWLIKCDKGHEQYLSWPDSIDKNKQIFICKKCGIELTDDNRRKGRWARKKGMEDAEYSGYWISLLMCTWISAKEILDYHKDKSEEYFYNKVLGLPYVGGGNKLTWELFAQNLTHEIITPAAEDKMVIGIDTGLKLDYVMGGREGLFYHGEAKDYDELDNHMRRWTKATAIIDAGGDLIGSRKFKERWPGRVFLAYFKGADKKGEELFTWGKGDEYNTVAIDRERGIQLTVDYFRERRLPCQGGEDDWYDYWLDWNNLTRIKIEDPKTMRFKGHKWVRSGRDHRALATVCWVAGISRFNQDKAEFLGESPVLGVPVGPYINPNQTTRIMTPLGQDIIEATLKKQRAEEDGIFNDGDWRDI